MIHILNEKSEELTNELIDRVMTEDNLKLVVPTFSEQGRVNNLIYDLLTDSGTKEVFREDIEAQRNKILVINEFFCMPPVTHKEGTKYLVDAGAKNIEYLRLIELFQQLNVDYEIYVVKTQY